MEGKKFDGDKPRYDLIDADALEGMAKVLTLGSIKYSDRNWEKVSNAENRYYSALMRHLEAFRRGITKDEETGLSHMYHVLSNAMFLAWFEKNRTESV